ncbi:MAG: NADPH-dependent 7-cyano-7-deazaguanine reductase QueF [Candidatus Aminicenantes bacterium]|nr:NADPH-dependent 7-cyano-7-deazaguanine reductase QueF [Candidatus Aminicenantes bacterium]
MSINRVTEDLIKFRRPESQVNPDVLEALPFQPTDPNTRIEISNPEFTSLCPKTGLPDYGTIRIRYVPRNKIVELKSLKYYFLQYRQTGIFYERLTRLIRDHLVALLDPLEIEVEARFTPRGGLSSTITSSYPAAPAESR